MSFSVRHEGSPVSVGGQSAVDVETGLHDGRWDPADEVRGDGEPEWVPLADHPRFAEAAADVVPPPRKHHPDETRLDMNPLIDVALVLLIFFILTTTYETIRKVLDLPAGSAKAPGQLRRVSPEDVKKLMVTVTARQQGGQAVLSVEDKPVTLGELDAALRRAVADSKKTTLLLDATEDVDYGVVMSIMDAARGAGIAKTAMAEKSPQK